MAVPQILALIVTVQIGARQPQVTYMYLYKEYYIEKVWVIAEGEIEMAKYFSPPAAGAAGENVFRSKKSTSNGDKNYSTYNITGSQFLRDNATVKIYQNWEDLVVDHFDKLLNCVWVTIKNYVI